jgi:hypothetical protein
MAKLRRLIGPPLTSSILIATLLARASHVPPRESERLGWSLDTLAVIGVEMGEPDQEFGRLIAGELGPNGEVYLLDLVLATVSVFDTEGRVRSATRVGHGPGEVRQPRAMSLDADGRLAVVDLGNARISWFEHQDGTLVPLESIPLKQPVRDMCVLGGRVFAGFLREGMMAHEIGMDGEILMSIGAAPPIDGLDGLGAHAVLAGRQILDGKLYCDADRDQVIVAGTSHPLIRTYDSSGTLRWETSLPGITSVGFQVGADGALHSHIDPERGANFVRSMVRWDRDHLLVQFEVRLADARLGDREFHGIDSRLIALDSGEEVARTTKLPLLTAVRGERFPIIENAPYPRALVVERR